MVTDSDLNQLAAELYERRHQSVFVPGAIAYIGDWTPAENQCHDNVDFWVKHNPTHGPVHGFLYFSFAGAMPYVWFNAHCIVRTEDDQLIDITPSKASQRYPFIEHFGPWELFVEAGKQIRLEYLRP
jgi:hypothetical protein